MRYIYENLLQIRLHRVHAKLSVEQCCELVGVGRRSWLKWEETGRTPKVALELLKARAGGIWDGWNYWNGELTDYAGRKYSEGDLMAAYYTLRAAESKNVEFLRASGSYLKHQNNQNWVKQKEVDRTEPIVVPGFDQKQASLVF